ncbi:MAG: glycosyltransferase family 4 protein [Bryobacteraceae bacterium]|jgi:glycosyltransferase involved in cell wall biosynthesis
MRVLILTSGVPFTRGGAEILAESLRDAVCAAGHQAEIVTLPFQSCPPSRVPEQMLACRLLDVTESCGMRIDRVIGLKFPAYLVPHPNKVIWMLHQHRTAYEFWDHPAAGDLIHYPDGQVVREAIHRADCTLLPEAKAIYTLSRNVSDRLRRCSGIDAEPLYNPPANALLFHNGPAGDYLFFPSRINSVKRQWLVIQALALCREPVRVYFAGEADNPAQQAECAKAQRELGLTNQVTWLGVVSEEQKCEWYANSLGVVFPPLDEDYGYVTLEAMLSSKPVITCADSGGPLEFVVHQHTGLVADASPQSLAGAMDALWADRRRAAALGEAGRERYLDLKISWENVVDKLLC